jgi:hypothetical protein
MEEIGKYVWIEDDTYSWLPCKKFNLNKLKSEDN